MKTLPNTWRSKGADYTIAKRKGDVVLIELRREGRTFYEVAIVQSHAGHTMAGKTFPPAEYLPAANHPDLPSAMAAFNEVSSIVDA